MIKGKSIVDANVDEEEFKLYQRFRMTKTLPFQAQRVLDKTYFLSIFNSLVKLKFNENHE